MKGVQNVFKLASAALAVVLVLAFTQVTFASPATTKLANKVENAIGVYYPGDFVVQATPDGVISIKGQTNTLYDKYRVFDIASRVQGVREIKDQVIVNTSELPNNTIKQNVKQELDLSNAILEPDRINVAVDNGDVILSGTVSTPNEKVVAETVASWQEGVRGIDNQIKVLPPSQATTDQNLHAILSDLLQHRFPLEKNVSFNVNAGVVTVTGQVHDLWSKNHIEKEFSSVPGVKKVVNNLTVRPLPSLG